MAKKKGTNKQTRLVESYTVVSKDLHEKTKGELFEDILLMKKIKHFAHENLKNPTNIYFINFLNEKITDYYKLLGQMK